MTNKWHTELIYGRAAPFIRHSYVVFDVSVLNQNLFIIQQSTYENAALEYSDLSFSRQAPACVKGSDSATSRWGRGIFQ